MTIYLATDHAGFDLKEKVKKFLENKGHDVKDFGARAFDAEDDYPDFILPAAQAVAKDKGSLGIIFGGSGQGEALAANKVPGARAALFYGGNTEIVKLSRSHNNANILSLGARFVDFELAKKAIKLWLAEKFEKGRHQRRINKISEFEKIPAAKY